MQTEQYNPTHHQAFINEFVLTAQVIGGSSHDKNGMNAYYDAIKLFFDEQDIVESFQEARRTLARNKFPVPAELTEIRDTVRKRRPQPALPAATDTFIPCPPHVLKILEDAGLIRPASSRAAFVSKVAF